MELQFNVTKENRKAFVNAISEITGQVSVYQGAPGFAFAVGAFIIDRYGVLVCNERTDTEDLRHLLVGLTAHGFALDGGLDGLMPAASEQGDAAPHSLTDHEAIFPGADSAVSNHHGDIIIVDSDASDHCSDSDGDNTEASARCEDSGGTDMEASVFDVDNAKLTYKSEPSGSEGSSGVPAAASDDSRDSGGDGTKASVFSTDGAGLMYEDEEPGAEGPCEAPVTATDDGSGKLSISVPASGYSAVVFANLEKLVAAKAWIIRKMTGADDLSIVREDDRLNFPWFKGGASAAEVDAYSRLVARLCETAKQKQRVVATERRLEDGDNEKFRARCFLLSLGFIGKEYAPARKILLATMSGSGSFKNGNQKKPTAPEGATATDSGEDNAKVVSIRKDGSSVDSTVAGALTPLKCSQCLHHCYYTGGALRTSAGEIVDTASRAPDIYTHYCLNAPSGFRKLKHAAEWSGFEAAPQWCSVSTEVTQWEGQRNENE